MLNLLVGCIYKIYKIIICKFFIYTNQLILEMSIMTNQKDLVFIYKIAGLHSTKRGTKTPWVERTWIHSFKLLQRPLTLVEHRQNISMVNFAYYLDDRDKRSKCWKHTTRYQFEC